METEAQDLPASLALARAGDAEAFREVYRAYATRLLRQAWLICGHEALAEELAQETLVEAWKSLRRYNGRCAFFTWLCAILLHRYRRHLRKQYWYFLRREPAELTTMGETLPDGGSLPDAIAELHDETDRVRRCIARLPAKHQQVIYLRFYVDSSLESIAAALGCSIGTVKSRLFHALEKLRRMPGLTGETAPQNELE